MPADGSSEKRRITPVVEEVVSDEENVEIPPNADIVSGEQRAQVEVKENIVNKETDLARDKEQKLQDILTHGEPKRSGNGGNFKVIFVTAFITALVIGLLAGGLYVYFDGISTLDRSNTPEATPLFNGQTEPVATSIPTPTPEQVDLSQYSVQVLNGSGTRGAAGTVADLLEEAGFTDVDAGNADRYDYQETIIQAKEDTPEEVIEAIRNTLSDSYTVTLGEELAQNTDYAITVIVGEVN